MPGSGVARVEVLPLFKPQTRTSNVPGVVSVMVIPPKARLAAALSARRSHAARKRLRYLNPKRAGGAPRCMSSGPNTSVSGLSVAVEVSSGFGLLQVSQQVEQALRSYLWPIPPGGQSNQGWPLGRTVRSLELEVIISQVPGVSEVNAVQLFLPQSDGSYQQISPNSDDNAELSLESWQLPEVLQVLVTPGTDGSGVMPAPLTPAVQTDNTVAVPVVPTVC